MNKRKTKKRLHLNNKEFQVLFRSGKKYFRYAINNICFAFGCSSLEYWIYFFEGKRVDGKEIQIGLQQIQGNGHRYKLDDISSITGRIQCYVH